MIANNAWGEVALYAAKNAKHVNSGWRLGEISCEFILKHAAGELLELFASPDNIEEMADILGCLFHYAQKKGWTQEMINVALAKKLAERFDTAPDFEDGDDNQ